MQRGAVALDDDGVLTEQHAFEVAVESEGLQRAQRFIALALTGGLLGGGDLAAGAGLHDLQSHAVADQFVDPILVEGTQTLDDDVRSNRFMGSARASLEFRSSSEARPMISSG